MKNHILQLEPDVLPIRAEGLPEGTRADLADIAHSIDRLTAMVEILAHELGQVKEQIKVADQGRQSNYVAFRGWAEELYGRGK